MRRSVLIAILGAVAVFVGLLAWLVVSVLANPTKRAEMTLGSAAKPPPVPAEFAMQEGMQSGLIEPSKALTEQEVAKAWKPAAEAGKQLGGRPWVLLEDADTGDIIFQSGADVAHVPASTMKNLSGFFALSQGDAQRQLSTGLNQEGDDLYLWGEGDLLLGAGAGDETALNGYAGVSDLTAQALQELDSDQTVTLYYQDALFPGETVHKAWVQQEVAQYAGKTAPFAVDSGRINHAEDYFAEDPAAAVASLVAQQLADGGVTVTAVKPWSYLRVAEEPATQVRQVVPGQVIAEVQSAPLIDQVHYMLLVSDNTMAQQLCQLAATEMMGTPADFTAATQQMALFLGEQGVSTQGLQINDCSGLDETSKVSGRTLVDTLSVASASPGLVNQLPRLLPISGYTGTLLGRLEDPAALGDLTAKTGSLGSVSSLAGTFTTTSGQNVVFAAGIDQVEDNAGWAFRDPLDTFLVQVASQ